MKFLGNEENSKVVKIERSGEEAKFWGFRTFDEENFTTPWKLSKVLLRILKIVDDFKL
jgi:hypothetical protein